MARCIGRRWCRTRRSSAPASRPESRQRAAISSRSEEEARAGPARPPAGNGEMHRTEMVPNEALERAREPPREPPAGRDLFDALGAPHIVAEESRAAILHAAGLRLGDVVEERSQLEGLPASGAVAEDL